MSRFDQAVAVVLQHEGGWVCDSADPGGETNFGISTSLISELKLSTADLGLPPDTVVEPGWLKAMTVDAAKEIYRREWWDRYSYDSIHDFRVATKIFDAAVNIGPRRAHSRAQVVVGAPADGLLGPISFAALNGFDASAFVASYSAQLAAYYRQLVDEKPALEVFLENWLHRAAWGS